MAALSRSLDKQVTLLIFTTEDPASLGQAKSLMAKSQWAMGATVEGHPTWTRDSLRMWQLSTHTVTEDHLDERWEMETGERVMELIFMSKHSASSGKPALTVHPIGVPYLPPGSPAPVGGRSGSAPPPSSRLGPWFRILRTVAAERGLVPEYEVTLEGTHHGPDVRVPAMYVEIGSCAEYWGREDAAEAVAEVFYRGLGLNGDPEVGVWTNDSAPPDGERLDGAALEAPVRPRRVMVGVGGGHYCPRHVDVAKRDGVWLGHLLPGYGVPMEEPSQPGAEVGGLWKESIRVAVAATATAFPGAEVAVHLDSK